MTGIWKYRRYIPYLESFCVFRCGLYKNKFNKLKEERRQENAVNTTYDRF